VKTCLCNFNTALPKKRKKTVLKVLKVDAAWLICAATVFSTNCSARR